MKNTLKSIYKKLILLNQYKQYNYLFNIDLDDIKKIGIKLFVSIIKEKQIKTINILIKNIDNINDVKLINILTKIVSINLFFELKNKLDLEYAYNIKNNLYSKIEYNYIFNIKYNKYDYIWIKQSIEKLNNQNSILLSQDFSNDQADIAASHFLEIFNLLRDKGLKIDTDYIRNESAYKNIYVLGPKELNFDLSEYCNANCIFCYTNGPGLLDNRDGDNENKYKQKISLESVFNIIKDSEYIGIERFSIGITGDPFINKLLIDPVLKKFGETNIKVGFLTNGYELINCIDGIVSCKNIENFIINISAGNYDSFVKTRIGDNFKNFLDTWKAIKIIKEKRPDIRIKALYVTTSQNYEGIEDFLILCEKNNVDEIEINKATTYEYNNELNIDNSHIKEDIFKLIKTLQNTHNFSGNIIKENTPKEKNIVKENCLNHHSYLAIFRNSIYSCCKFAFKFGNTQNSSIIDTVKKVTKNNKLFRLNKEDLSNEKCNRCIQYKNTIELNNYIKIKNQLNFKYID